MAARDEWFSKYQYLEYYSARAIHIDSNACLAAASSLSLTRSTRELARHLLERSEGGFVFSSHRQMASAIQRSRKTVAASMRALSWCSWQVTVFVRPCDGDPMDMSKLDHQPMNATAHREFIREKAGRKARAAHGPARNSKCSSADDTCSSVMHWHHSSYTQDKWLDVVPLCSSHHAEWHRNNTPTPHTGDE